MPVFIQNKFDQKGNYFKHLCETMGGEIKAESEPTKGSLFTTRLPVYVSQPD